MVNYESYRERCENKDKPEMECDGSCQVQKEVAEASDATSSNAKRSLLLALMKLLGELAHICPENPFLDCPQTHYRRFLSPNTIALLFGVYPTPFQPPRA